MAEARKRAQKEASETESDTVLDDKTRDMFVDEPLPADIALAKLIAEIDQSDERAKVRVEKLEVNGTRRDYVLLFECPPSKYDIMDVQSEYGGGEYKITVFGKQPNSNYYGWLTKQTIKLGEPRQRKTQEQTQHILTAQDVATIVQQTIATAMPRQPSRSEMLAELAQMRDLFMPAITRTETPAPLAAQSKSLAEQLQEVITISKLLKGDPLPVGEDGEVDAGTLTLNKGIDLIKTMMEKSAPPAIAPAPAPAPVVPPMLGNPVALSPDEEEMNLLLNSLLFAAKTNMPIESLAQTVYEKMPDEVFDALLNEQIWWSALLQLMPKAQPYQEYFMRLRARVLELYQADESENLTPPHATGIESQAKTNGGNVEGQSGTGGTVTRQ